MLKAFTYRLYPKKQQAELLNRHFGACRFVYNLALEVKRSAYAGNRVNLSCYSLMEQLVELKAECPWLSEINSQSLQQAIIHLDNAFTCFFKGKANFPRFKKKSARASFTIPQNVVLERGRLIIAKFKEGIEVVVHRPPKGILKRAIVSRTPSGKYFVSIVCDTKEAPLPKAKVTESTTIGVDLGIKSFLVTSDGKKLDNPKFLKHSFSKLRFTQQRYAKHQGRRTRQRRARLHEKVAAQRKDFLHKASTELIRENQSIALEDLNIKGLLQNHRLAGSIIDCGWSTFVTMLEYKALWQGRNILRIRRFEPSSKTCSHCGYLNKELTLQQRQWTCKGCGSLIDRDINAAINIKNFASKSDLLGNTEEKSWRTACIKRSFDP